MMDDPTGAKPNGFLKWALVLVPALLVLSTAGAVWFHWHSETSLTPHPGLALAASAVDDDELRDVLKKLTRYLGPRDWKTPEGRGNMRGALALIEGTLSPRNFGYVVRRDGALPLAGERWPVVWADAKGQGKGVVLVAAPYDIENESVAALLVLAAELREAGLERTLRFVFYPSDLWRTSGKPDLSFLREGNPDWVLCVNRLHAGPGRDLWLVGPDLRPGEHRIREIADFHESDRSFQLDGIQFSGLTERVYEVRGTREGRPAGEETEVRAMAGRDLETGEFEDLRARVRRLAEILRVAAGE